MRALPAEPERGRPAASSNCPAATPGARSPRQPRRSSVAAHPFSLGSSVSGPFSRSLTAYDKSKTIRNRIRTYGRLRGARPALALSFKGVYPMGRLDLPTLLLTAAALLSGCGGSDASSDALASTAA